MRLLALWRAGVKGVGGLGSAGVAGVVGPSMDVVRPEMEEERRTWV